MSYVFLPCSGWQLLTAHFCDYVSPGGGYFGVKRIGMTVGNPRKVP